MFVVHDITDGIPTTRDFGHVNQFFRHAPLFRQAKDEPIFKECVAQGFIYVSQYKVSQFGRGASELITYHKTLSELNDEVCYNKQSMIGRGNSNL